MERSAGSQLTLRSWSLGSHRAASCSFRVGGAGECAEVAVHGQVEGGVVIFYGGDGALYYDAGVQFFKDFAG